MVKNVTLQDNDENYDDYDILIAGSCDQLQLSPTNIYIDGFLPHYTISAIFHIQFPITRQTGGTAPPPSLTPRASITLLL